MTWEKKGLIYVPDGRCAWMNNSVLTPQPYLLNEDVIRVYASFRDANGIGRIGFVDLDAANPQKILSISPEPVVQLGDAGQFDDNGMLLGDVLNVDGEIWMYYVAFQLVGKIKFYAFSGLAKSRDGGNTFVRYSRVPVMDRAEEGIFGRCIHSVLRENGMFRIWYSVIFDWTYVNGIPYPTYDIKYIESEDGMHIGPRGVQCIRCHGNEYRIGRPRVRKISESKYEMRYTSDTLEKEYRAGYAESVDGINWVRKDELSGLNPSADGFDSEMACYPVVQETKYGTYMFYDGNGMGRAGFGYAVAKE